MRQARQILGSGALELGEVPLPVPAPGEVLVRNHYSFVSVGTEKMKLTQARMSLAEKARARPDQVKLVLDTLKAQGLVPTLRKVRERLRAPASLGYSCAGTVVMVGSQVSEFRTGDRVACIGEGVATHAEYNSVPRNLVAHVPAGVSLEAASAGAIGAIALQAIRQAKLGLGECVAIVGLGLLGQFLVQLCRANGCRVVGVDLDPGKCALAVENGAQAACAPDADEALDHALRASAGDGVDAVFLTLSAKDPAPVALAAALVRDRGRVVCLGNTAIELDWRTWFSKEIDFVFSRAMGAGINEPEYFARGGDYPIGHVRWTANRNLQAFVDLLGQGKVSLERIITHRFPFSEAVAVFDRIAGGELNHAVGIVFEYPEPEPGVFELQPRILTFGGERPRGAVRLGQIGAGNYAKSMLMPCFASLAGMSLEGICTSKGSNAEALARRYGFRKATADAGELLRDPAINAIMVATRHDSHAAYARAALESGKHAYVEKPLAMSEEQLAPITAALAARGADGPTLWVGHNRRFSLLTQGALAHLRGVEVRQITCSVRAAAVPADSWYQDPVEGGGILFGDVCHYIDLAIYFAQSLPVEVCAFATSDRAHREESWAITLRFANGGLGVVHYVCGSRQGHPETIEMRGGGRAARIVGFRRLVLDGGAGSGMRRLQPDLGQPAMLRAMVAQFSGAPGAADYTESFLVSAQALLAASRSIAQRRIVTLEPRFPFRLG